MVVAQFLQKQTLIIKQKLGEQNKTKNDVLSKAYVHTRNRFQRSEACIDIRSFRPCSHNPRSSRTGRDASRTRPRLPDIVYDVKVLKLLKGLLALWVKVTNLCKLSHSAAPQNPRHSRNGTIQSHSRTSSSRHTCVKNIAKVQ